MDQNTRASLIQQFAHLWSAVAWKSYQLQGRGVFVVQVQQEGDDLSLTIEYLSAAECRHAQARRLLATYNPAVEYVLLFATNGADAECTLMNLGRSLAEVAAEVAPVPFVRSS